MTEPDRVERLWLGTGGGDAVRPGGGRGGRRGGVRRGGVRRRDGSRAGGSVGHRRPDGAGCAWAGPASRCHGSAGSRLRAAAADRDEAAPGRHLPSGHGGIGECADRRSCAAEALMETRSVVGDTERDRSATKAAPDADPEKPLPLRGGRGFRRRFAQQFQDEWKPRATPTFHHPSVAHGDRKKKSVVMSH
jgi:hypothetical protein